MKKDLTKLKPYKSLLLAHVRDGVELKRSVNELLNDLYELLSLDEEDPRTLVSRTNKVKAGELEVGYLHYLEEQRVAWSLDPALIDHVHQLALVCRRKRHVAIYLSDTTWRSAIAKKFGAGSKGLGGLQKIEPGLLNAAFVKGAARTLWLSGTHARTAIKADNKILSGIELQDALDPLGDQTYYFTAARCATDFDKDVSAVGTSPRGSRIWMSSSRSWDEFQRGVTSMLHHLETTTKPVKAPIPVVAVSSVDTSDISDAFDVAIIPPELLSDDPSVETREEMEQWAYHSRFKIVKKSKANFTAQAELKKVVLGKIEFQMDLRDLQNVRWELKSTPASLLTREELANATAVCRRPNWVKIWYDSGHTVSDGAVFEVRHRDVPFADFLWVDYSRFKAGKGFGQYDVGLEKPSALDLATVGAENSLFCWVKNFWPNIVPGSLAGGWLACDDGSMEIADFIHLDDKTTPPKLSLIHVKGSSSADPARGISVSDYEVVTAQAIKNLRSLDRAILAEGLEGGLRKKISELVWHNRTPTRTARRAMLAALKRIGSHYQRQVVIIQPRLTRARTDYARANRGSTDAARLRQLDTLLLEAESACHGLQSRLVVLCADDKRAIASLPKMKKPARTKP